MVTSAPTITRSWDPGVLTVTGDIADADRRFAASRADQAHRLFGGIAPQVRHHHLATFGSEAQGGSAADGAAGTGDDHHLVVEQALHGMPGRLPRRKL